MTTLSWRCLSLTSSFLIPFSHSASWLWPFTPKSSTFFSIWYLTWSYPISIEFCVHLLLMKIKDSILSKLFNSLLISSYFSTFCKDPLLQLLSQSFNLFLCTLYLSFNFFNLHFFFNVSSSLTSLSTKLTSCLSLFISSSILRFHLFSFFVICSYFFNPIRSATQTLAAVIKLFL